MWAMGDYDRFARATVWELGPVLVDACGITPGQRVLDVAAGTGNVAIRAAMKGASVVACDLTPEHFEGGRRGAAAAGVDLEWIEGDAEALPFDDGAFDVVTSCFGAMFAPDHRAVADELVRVCRPGGTIGLMSFTPEGTGGEFFALLAPYAPPAPRRCGASSPVGERRARSDALWRPREPAHPEPAHLHRARAQSRGLLPLVHGGFGPLVAIRAGLDDHPERRAELDRAFLEAVIRWNQGRATGPSRLPTSICWSSAPGHHSRNAQCACRRGAKAPILDGPRHWPKIPGARREEAASARRSSHHHCGLDEAKRGGLLGRCVGHAVRVRAAQPWQAG